MAEKEVGKIKHYFDNIGVAVVEVTGTLKKGDKIHVKGHTTDFTQTVGSMQIEHKVIEQAKKGQSVGMKIQDKVRGGDTVYKA